MYIDTFFYYGNEPYYPSQNFSPEWLCKIQSIQSNNVKEVFIYTGGYSYRVTLKPPSDMADIERVLKAVQSIWLSDKQARVSTRLGFDELIIRPKVPNDPYTQTIRIYGCFDPARAPIISPQMRSYEFSKVMQDIVKRKGKKIHHPKGHYNEKTKEWEYK